MPLSGPNNPIHFSLWQGTVRWICKSPYRPGQKRKNWHVGIELLEEPAESAWSLNDIRIEAMRSSGPGGQHVNTTESAVRVTHLPSGATAQAREERSQHMNRKLALARLDQKLKELHLAAQSRSKRQQWEQHNSLERGNSVRTYAGEKFELQK